MILGSIIFTGITCMIVVLFIYQRIQHNFQWKIENHGHEYEIETLKTKLEVQEQKMENISQEIHDNIGQMLSFVKLNIATIDLDQTEQAAVKIVQSNELLTQAIRDLRALPKTLSATFIAEIGLAESIHVLLDYLEKSGTHSIGFSINGMRRPLAPEAEILIFRVIQELLNNIIKHAEATHIIVEIVYEESDLQITVKDNGKGFEATSIKAHSQYRGLGLSNIQRRLNVLSGTIAIRSELQKGTTAALYIPLHHYKACGSCADLA